MSKNFSEEVEVRNASKNKALYCTDPECSERILKYCHGDKREPYFAHLSNKSCDYSLYYDETPSTIKTIKQRLFRILTEKGFAVDLDVKLIKHHYTHLVVMLDDKKIAVELVNKHTTANTTSYLSKEYADIDIKPVWLIIDDDQVIWGEQYSCHIKRFVLNTSTNKDIIIISKDGNKVIQSIEDTNEYKCNGEEIYSRNYPKIYDKIGRLDDITVENFEISMEGFFEEYLRWLNKKKNAFNRYLDKLREEERVREMEMLEYKKNRDEWKKNRLAVSKKQSQSLPTRLPIESQREMSSAYPHLHDSPAVEVGMKVFHEDDGELLIIGVDVREKMTIIRVVDSNGEISSKDWNVLWAYNKVKFI